MRCFPEKRSGTSFITGECVIVQTKETLYVEVKQSVFHNRLRFRKPLKNKGKINLKKVLKKVLTEEEIGVILTKLSPRSDKN